jgi:glycosyltransferase involved in cell wall biosynthesis
MIKRVNIKVLICSNAYPPYFIGGAELVAHAQAKQLQNLGFDVLIFSGDPSEHGKRHSIRREDYDGIPVYRIRLTYEDYDSKFLNFTHRDVENYFKKILLQFSPDIVHFHNIIGLSVGLIHLAKHQGVRTIVTLHDHWGFCFKNTIIKNSREICHDFMLCSECMEIIPGENNINLPMRLRQDYIAMQLEEVDAFISPSQYLAGVYIRAGIPPNKMNVVLNGVDVFKFEKIKKNPYPAGRIRFTFIGYFGKHKGIHILLEALKYLDRKSFRINLIGSGELLTQYENEIRKRDLTNEVKFWGRIDDIKTAYAETDVFILPSVWPENQPVTITEAMAAGIPVIAANSGGIPELVDNEITGFLFTSGDASDLARKMRVFIENPSLIKTFGASGYERIKTNTLQNQIIEILRVYTKPVSPPSEKSQRLSLISCVGEHFPSEIIEGIKIIQNSLDTENYRFVMSDWLQADQENAVTIGLVLDSTTTPEKIRNFLKHEIPLLVPEKNGALKNLCITAQCGLYYTNSFEVEGCIKFLQSHDRQRWLMGKNGFRYFSRFMH